MFTSKKALLLLANGSEDSEVVITIDVNIFKKKEKFVDMIYFQRFFVGQVLN
jgi:hypothetical protein